LGTNATATLCHRLKIISRFSISPQTSGTTLAISTLPRDSVRSGGSSIHRVFQILDQKYKSNKEITRFLRVLTGSADAALVSLNWDVVVENHLFHEGLGFSYDIPCLPLNGGTATANGIPLIKLHGSANWHYCDSCHATLIGGQGEGKTALVNRTFLEAADFERLGADKDVVEKVEAMTGKRPQCPDCGNPKTTARVATFSYAKAFDFFPFHASWDAALKRLRQASRWIFIGYSLPDADFEFKHLLKTAQLASGQKKEIHVVVKEGGDVIERYRRFFGLSIHEKCDGGFEAWVQAKFGDGLAGAA